MPPEHRYISADASAETFSFFFAGHSASSTAATIRPQPIHSRLLSRSFIRAAPKIAEKMASVLKSRETRAGSPSRWARIWKVYPTQLDMMAT